MTKIQKMEKNGCIKIGLMFHATQVAEMVLRKNITFAIKLFNFVVTSRGQIKGLTNCFSFSHEPFWSHCLDSVCFNADCCHSNQLLCVLVILPLCRTHRKSAGTIFVYDAVRVLLQFHSGFNAFCLLLPKLTRSSSDFGFIL